MQANLYKKKTCKFLLLFGLTAYGSALGVSAQMNNSNGAFTINSTATASSTNFRNWLSFSQALQNVTRNDGGPLFGGAGISTAIEVNVQTSMTETLPVSFPDIAGTSSTNNIRINGGGNFVAFASTSTTANKAVIAFTGGDFFRILNLTIRNTGTVAPWGIWFSNQSNHNLIENCIVEFSAWNSLVSTHGATASAFINFSASAAGTNQTGSIHPGQFDTIRACTLRTTNTNSPGPTFGINILGSTTLAATTETNNTIERNIIQNFYVNGVMDWYTNGDRINNNDISRVNAGTSLPVATHMGIRAEYIYSSNRVLQINSNLIHDLPFNGSSISTTSANPYGVYTVYIYGNSSAQAEVNNNNIYNLRSLNLFYGMFNWYTFDTRISGNVIRDNASGSTSVSWGMQNWYNTRTNIDNNFIRDNQPFANFDAIECFFGSTGTVTGNQITNNISTTTTSFHNHRGLDIQNPTNVLISRNQIIGNETRVSSTLWGIEIRNPNNTQTESNLVAKQRSFSTQYAIYGLNFSGAGNNTIDNNTIDIATVSPTTFNFLYSIFIQGNSTTGPWRVRGNIVQQTTNDYYNYMLFLAGQITGFAEVDYNVFFSSSTTPILYFGVAGGAATTGNWPGVLGTAAANLNTGSAPIGATRNNIFVNPRFADRAANDYRALSWRCQNSMPTVTGRDKNNNPRNPISSDRGSRENFTDLQATSVTWNAGSNPCSNFSERPTISIRNNYTDTAYNFNVSYRVNNGPKVTERFSGRIMSGQSGNYTFQTPVRLVPGAVRLQVFIDIPDDNRANDTQVFNMNVRPAPSGGSLTLTEGLNDPRRNLEVTIENQSVKYTFSAPRMYTNSDYGTGNRWTATPFARSVGGRNVPGYISLSQTPSSSATGEITFTPTNLSDEDSTFIVGVIINDVQNGCDTVIQRRVFVQPLGRPAFTIPAVNCLGDATFFENKSTVKSGALDYIWHFGDGDTSIASNPVHTYARTGTFNVRLVTITNPYGFTNEITVPITINAVPSVDFSKQNVCDGNMASFTNRTTPASPTSYEWNFGDGSAVRTALNPTHRYSRVGSYVVSLKATLNGCSKTESKNFYVFPKPVAGFNQASGDCQNQLFTFNNTSRISSGTIGFFWDFDDNGAIGTLRDETHQFSTPGIHNVKLKAISEFGCVDSNTRIIVAKPSPIASFINTPTCSITPTTFTNTTPRVTGTNASYRWDFGDGSNSTVTNPVKPWTTLGPKNVKMRVELDNGCSDEVSRVLSVGIQPTADFNTNDVCAGQQMVFVNRSTWPQGDIRYLWNFADGNTSNDAAPRYTYQGVTNTRVFNVTLYAFIEGGCADSITKQVTVNEGPRTCDFDADINYSKGFRGVDFTPRSSTGSGAQPGVTYTWLYDREGQSSGAAGFNNFQEDGVYRITMRARNANGCECVAVKSVTINRRNVEETQGLNAQISVYPNPNRGEFAVEVAPGGQSDLEIGLYNILGTKVADIPTRGLKSGIFNVQATNLSSGIYFVKITAAGETATRKVHIQH